MESLENTFADKSRFGVIVIFIAEDQFVYYTNCLLVSAWVLLFFTNFNNIDCLICLFVFWFVAV